MLKKNAKDTRALYAKGVAYATLATFEATIRRSWLSAARKAKTARNLPPGSFEYRSEFQRCENCNGTYNYAVGSLSWGTRLIVGVIGLGGDDKEPASRISNSQPRKAHRSQVDAKMLLVVVYGREESYEKALKLLDELHQKYPRNFMFDMSKASLYGKMNRWDLASQTYRDLADKIAAHKDGYERLRIEKVWYELANSQLQAEKYEDASRSFGLVTTGGSATTAAEKANAHLWMGRMSDTRNDRPDALKHYNAVLLLDVQNRIQRTGQTLQQETFLILNTVRPRCVILSRSFGPLAQLVEHLTFNQRVAGSSPARLINYLRPILKLRKNGRGNARGNNRGLVVENEKQEDQEEGKSSRQSGTQRHRGHDSGDDIQGHRGRCSGHDSRSGQITEVVARPFYPASSLIRLRRHHRDGHGALTLFEFGKGDEPQRLMSQASILNPRYVELDATLVLMHLSGTDMKLTGQERLAFQGNVQPPFSDVLTRMECDSCHNYDENTAAGHVSQSFDACIKRSDPVNHDG